MTSFHTTYKWYLKIYHAELLSNGCVPVDERKGRDNSEHWKVYIKKYLDNGTLIINKEMEKFIKLNHTIGNLCPVPENFNVPRSNFGKWDFWEGYGIIDPLPNAKQKLDALIESCSKMIEARGKRIEEHML